MSQNIDQFLKNIKYDGSYIVDVLKCIDINQLSFAKQKFFRKQQPDPEDIQNYYEKALEITSETVYAEIIAEVALFLQSEPFQNIDTKIIYDMRMAYEVYERITDSFQQNECKTLFDICDFSYIAKINQSIESVRDKEITLRHIYNFINWILLHQKGLRSLQPSKEQSRNISQNASLQPSKYTSYNDNDNSNMKSSLLPLAHIFLVQIVDQKQLLVFIGFNTLRSEVFHSLETFRQYNYERNRLPAKFIPKYSVEGLCSILYHYFSVLRKIMRQNDTHLYDLEVKKILSANAEAIIKNPQKSKNLPKLQNFDQCYFQLFEIAHSIEELAQNLHSFSFRKVLVLNLLESLDTLYILDTQDMAYNVIHTSKYLLTCFQYKTKDTEYKQLSRNQVFEELITRIYAITTGEVDLEKLVKRPPKKKKKNVQKIVVNVNEEQQERKKKVTVKHENRHDQVMINLKHSINTAMKWFDEGKYQIQTKNVSEEQDLSEFPYSLEQKETILKTNSMISSYQKEKLKVVEQIPAHLRGWTRGLVVDEAENLRMLDQLLRKIDLNLYSDLTKAFQDPSKMVQQILQIIFVQEQIIHEFFPILYQNFEKNRGRQKGENYEVCEIVLEAEIEFYACKIIQTINRDIDKIYYLIESSQSFTQKSELVDLFFNYLFNKYVNKQEKGMELAQKFIEMDISPLFQEFQIGKEPFKLFQESFLCNVLIVYFSQDIFEDYLGILIQTFNQSITFTEEESQIIAEVSTRKDKSKYEKRLYEKIFLILFSDELLVSMQKQMIYTFHHISKFLEKEYQDYGDKQIQDHYYKWSFLGCVYLYTIVQPRIQYDITTGRTFTSTFFYENLMQQKNLKNNNPQDNALIRNLKLKRLLSSILSNPTDIARDNMLIIRRFFRKIDDLYYQNRMLSLAQNTNKASNLSYYLNLKNMEEVYGGNTQTNNLKYQSINQSVHLEKLDVPPDPQDKSVFVSQQYLLKARHIILIMESYKNYLYHNYHNKNSIEGNLLKFLMKSSDYQKVSTQLNKSDDYVLIQTQKYPIDDIDNMLKYQNKYKDNYINLNEYNQINQSANHFSDLMSRVNITVEDSEKLVNPYQLIFDQINIGSLIDLIQDLINVTKIARDILENTTTDNENVQLFKRKMPKLIQNQRQLQTYRVIQEVIDNDLAQVENDGMILKQKVLFSNFQ